MKTTTSSGTVRIRERCPVIIMLPVYIYCAYLYVYNADYLYPTIASGTSFRTRFLKRNHMKKIRNMIDSSRLRTYAVEIYSGTYEYNQVCRFHNACIRENGKLIIDRSWKAEEGLLISQCKDLDFEYMDTNSVHPGQNVQQSNLDLIGIGRNSIVIDTKTRNQHSFLEHFIEMYFILRLLQTPLELLNVHQFICPTNDPCLKNHLEKQAPLNIGLKVPTNLSFSEQDNCVSGFLTDMPGNPVIIPGKKLQSRVHCFNSVMSYSSQILKHQISLKTVLKHLNSQLRYEKK